MTRIAISDMRFYAHHGCFEQEQTIGTHFRVDLSFVVDTQQAEQSDNIEHTVNYLEVYQVVKQQMGRPSHLLEHVMRRVGESILAQFLQVQQVWVKVSKLNPPLGGDIGAVSVERVFDR